ncbi:hypothetical protein DHC50_18625 [Arenibacter sp. A80]|nr:hypothetical protein [Arenibacter sp. A80]RFT54768.1 hypothetical protein D0S24_18620 [Arenibacter sp. P308M17]
MIFLFQACSSDDSPNDENTSKYYFRYKLDGTQIDYPFKPETQINLTGIYEYDSNSESYGMQVFGAANILDSGQTNRLVIYIGNSAEVTTNITYTNIEAPDSTVPDLIFSMGYTDMVKTMFVTSKNIISTQLYKNAKIRYDKISEDNIQGTFSGILSNYDTSTGQPILTKEVIITDGEFNVPRY